MLFLIKRSHFQEYRQKNFEKSIVIEKKTLPLQSIWRFRSSVGLEQQPSKLWVLRSNRSRITKKSIGRNSDGFFCIVDGGVIYLSCPREDLRIIDLPGTR